MLLCVETASAGYNVSGVYEQKANCHNSIAIAEQRHSDSESAFGNII